MGNMSLKVLETSMNFLFKIGYEPSWYYFKNLSKCLLPLSRRTKGSFENWLKRTRFSVELRVPRTVCVMLNVVIHAKKQVSAGKSSF